MHAQGSLGGWRRCFIKIKIILFWQLVIINQLIKCQNIAHTNKFKQTENFCLLRFALALEVDTTRERLDYDLIILFFGYGHSEVIRVMHKFRRNLQSKSAQQLISNILLKVGLSK